MAAPKVPIEVDPESGVWSTDGLPMLYVPRHFFINNHLAVEDALGREAYARLLYDAGYGSAVTWCEREAETHGLAGFEVFHHYMRRISQRGWGQFTVQSLDEATCEATVRVQHSVFVEHFRAGAADGKAESAQCYMFAGWLPGALAWAGRTLGREAALNSTEVHCAAQGAHDHCLFRVTAG